MSNLLLWEQSQSYLATMEEIKHELKQQFDINNKLKLFNRQLTNNYQNLSEQIETFNTQQCINEEQINLSNNKITKLKQDHFQMKNQRDQLEANVHDLKQHLKVNQSGMIKIEQMNQLNEQLTNLLEISFNHYLQFITICGQNKLPSYLNQIQSLQPQLQIGLQILQDNLTGDKVGKLEGIVDNCLCQIFQEFQLLVTQAGNLKMDNKINYQKITYLESRDIDSNDKILHEQLKKLSNENSSMKLELQILRERLLDKPEREAPNSSLKSQYFQLSQLITKICDNIPYKDIRDHMNRILIRAGELKGQNLLIDETIQKFIHEIRLTQIGSNPIGSIKVQPKYPNIFLSRISTSSHIDESVKVSYQNSPLASDIVQKESDKDSNMMRQLFSSSKRKQI